MRIVVLGAGFGGLELTSRLSDEFGDEVEVVLIDQSDGFVFGFSKLDVMFGRTSAGAVHHAYADMVKPGVRVRAGHDPGHRPRGQAGRDRRRDLRGGHPGGRPRCGPRPGRHARSGRGGPRVLHGRRGLRPPRRAGGVRGWPGDRGGDVDAVQVPAGAERDGPADARLPDRAGPARPFRDRAGHAAGRAHPAVAGRVGGVARGLRRAGDRLAPRAVGPRPRPGPQGGPAQRRDRPALRPLPRRAEAPCAGRRAGRRG